ncbi:gonadotropin subunit beta-1-like [Antennarius striatus]|uniref:gonadotropin subunit beta-1-like n=1 Tax=Antennarius striatus TaxID=241820 RepID=UPI0035B0078B
MFQRVTEETSTTTAEPYRRLPCTKQRMQLVVMAAVLLLVRTGHSCILGCHPTNVSILVESCGIIESVHTTMCAGHCYLEYPVYIGHGDRAEQSICNGEWSYEVKHIKGCPVSVTYPVAKHCSCTTCNEGNTDCGRLLEDIPSCLLF